jgi:hypothetical protein
MATPVTGIRIPSELLARIDVLAIDGKNRTDVILELIRLGLGDELPGSNPSQLGEIRELLNVLNDRLTELEAVTLHKFDDRLTELENRTTLVQRPSNDQPIALLKKSSDNALEQPVDNAPVQSIVKHRSTVAGKVASENYGVLPPDSEKGLSQTDLCNFYGLSWRNLKRDSVRAGFDAVEEYLRKMTGITWVRGKASGMTKLYFPVGQ